MSTQQFSFQIRTLSQRSARMLGVLVMGALLTAAAPSFAAGPAVPRPDLPLRNPGQPLVQRVDPGAITRSEANRTRVDVLVVYANNSGNIDPKLAGLGGVRKQLQTLGFNGASVLSTHSDQLGPAQSTTVAIQGNRKLEITLVDFNAENAKVRMEMFLGSEKKWDTTMSSPRGRPILSGGTPHQEGKLMFVVTVP